MGSTGTAQSASGSGGMDELLPLVLQLTNPDQVRYRERKKDMLSPVIVLSASACGCVLRAFGTELT